MEVLYVLLMIIIIILIVSLQGNVKTRLQALELEIRRLREQMQTPRAESVPVPAVVAPVVAPVVVPVAPPVPLIPPVPEEKWTSGFTVVPQQSLTEQLESLLHEQGTVPEPMDEPQPGPVASEPAPALSTPAPALRNPSFLERNPDLEKFIGENLISKIGIAILVLAIGFFVKYAIDNDWIGPVGRVGIGIICGGILVAVAHRLRKSYSAFSSVLVGGGLAIFYFTITLAFHQFHLFSQLVAFGIMVVITYFAVLLSHLYNRQELAIIALVGGFATPFMVHTGSGNYKGLFTYLLILNTGLLVIAYRKAWRLLNLLAFIFTVVLFGSWLLTVNTDMVKAAAAGPAAYRNGFLFATAFYLLFFAINIAHNIRENKKFIASDFGILLANTSLYFAAGLYCLTLMKAGEYRGLFSALMGIFNLAASFMLFRNRKTDKNILYLLIGVTLSFISLTAPIQLNGNNITLFWASESVLLYWLYRKSKISIIRVSSFIVWIAMLISLLMDWANVYGTSSNAIPVVANKGFITTVFAALASYLLFILHKKAAEQALHAAIPVADNLFRVTGIVLLFAAGAIEINHQFSYHYRGANLPMLYLLLYSFAFVLLFMAITGRVAALQLQRYVYVKAALFAVCVMFYLGDIQYYFNVQRQMLEQHRLAGHFVAHWLAAVLMAVILYQLAALLSNNRQGGKKNADLLTWVLCIIVVTYLSVEVQLLANTAFFNRQRTLEDIQRVYVKTGLPILWGLCSFGFMWLGMKHTFRPLRIVSLSLFLVILLKLFIFDIRNIPVAGKIAAFFSLGVLLLVVSFMYQRLKKIIIEDEKKPMA